MATPRKRQRRRRKVPRNIVEKPDREIVERVLGKRVLKELDRVVSEELGEAEIGGHDAK
jgi:hypothetical protein